MLNQYQHRHLDYWSSSAGNHLLVPDTDDVEDVDSKLAVTLVSTPFCIFDNVKEDYEDYENDEDRPRYKPKPILKHSGSMHDGVAQFGHDLQSKEFYYNQLLNADARMSLMEHPIASSNTLYDCMYTQNDGQNQYEDQQKSFTTKSLKYYSQDASKLDQVMALEERVHGIPIVSRYTRRCKRNTITTCIHNNRNMIVHVGGPKQDILMLREARHLYPTMLYDKDENNSKDDVYCHPLDMKCKEAILHVSCVGSTSWNTDSLILARTPYDLYYLRTASLGDHMRCDDNYNYNNNNNSEKDIDIEIGGKKKRGRPKKRSLSVPEYQREMENNYQYRDAAVLEPLQKWTLPHRMVDLSHSSSMWPYAYILAESELSNDKIMEKKNQCMKLYEWNPSYGIIDRSDALPSLYRHHTRGVGTEDMNPFLYNHRGKLNPNIANIEVSAHPKICYMSTESDMYTIDFRLSAPAGNRIFDNRFSFKLSQTENNNTQGSSSDNYHLYSSVESDTLAYASSISAICHHPTLSQYVFVADHNKRVSLLDIRFPKTFVFTKPTPCIYDHMKYFDKGQLLYHIMGGNNNNNNNNTGDGLVMGHSSAATGSQDISLFEVHFGSGFHHQNQKVDTNSQNSSIKEDAAVSLLPSTLPFGVRQSLVKCHHHRVPFLREDVMKQAATETQVKRTGIKKAHLYDDSVTLHGVALFACDQHPYTIHNQFQSDSDQDYDLLVQKARPLDYNVIMVQQNSIGDVYAQRLSFYNDNDNKCNDNDNNDNNNDNNDNNKKKKSDTVYDEYDNVVNHKNRNAAQDINLGVPFYADDNPADEVKPPLYQTKKIRRGLNLKRMK